MGIVCGEQESASEAVEVGDEETAPEHQVWQEAYHVLVLLTKIMNSCPAQVSPLTQSWSPYLPFANAKVLPLTILIRG